MMSVITWAERGGQVWLGQVDTGGTGSRRRSGSTLLCPNSSVVRGLPPAEVVGGVDVVPQRVRGTVDGRPGGEFCFQAGNCLVVWVTTL